MDVCLRILSLCIESLYISFFVKDQFCKFMFFSQYTTILWYRKRVFANLCNAYVLCAWLAPWAASLNTIKI